MCWRPDRSDQVVFADHAVVVADQVGQEIENLGLERNEIAPAAQLAPISVEREILKPEKQLRTPYRLLYRNVAHPRLAEKWNCKCHWATTPNCGAFVLPNQ
jgi:hypothetical protein